jgi:protein TonB
MEIKKNTIAVLDDKRPLWWLFGFIVALMSLMVALEYTSHDSISSLDEYSLEELAQDLAFMPPEEDRSVMNLPQTEPANQIAERLVDADSPDDVRDLPDNQIEAESADDAPERPLPPPVLPPAVFDDESAKPVFRVVEQLPAFPGGMMEFMKWLSKNLKYPSTARQSKIQGTVTASFVVNSDGTTCDVKIVKSADATLDREALRVLRMMPKWEPGVSEGKPCRTLVQIPVVFKL